MCALTVNAMIADTIDFGNERFEPLRAHLSTAERTVICDLPPALTCCGWALHPTTVYEWNAYFAALTDPILQPVQDEVVIHLFTDGSCFDQHLPAQRFAAWSIVQADSRSTLTSNAKVVAALPLPGLLQSAVRAETYAILQALRITADVEGEVYIWTDCDAVVKKVKKIQAGHEVLTNSGHADLWTEITCLLRTRKYPCHITHVSTHRNPDYAVNFLQDWCFSHNALADQAAVAANQTRDGMFWDLHERHCQATAVMSHYNCLVQTVQLRISQEVVREEKPVLLEAEVPEVDEPHVRLHWTGLPSLQIPPAAVRWYGDALVRSIVSWFWHGISEAHSAPVWMSHFQLYADFMLATGDPGPVRLSTAGQWQDGRDVSHIELRGFGFKQRTRWFAKVWKEVLRHQGIELSFHYGRPQSQMVLMFTGVAAVPWPQYRIAAVDKWMLGCSGVTYRRQSKLLDALPYARQHPSFPPAVLTSFGL